MLPGPAGREPEDGPGAPDAARDRRHGFGRRGHRSRTRKSPSITGRATLYTGTAPIALAIYYFVGVDQGAVSVFGNNVLIHEFVHDGRHFLGFPCH